MADNKESCSHRPSITFSPLMSSHRYHICRKCQSISFLENKPFFCSECRAKIVAARTNKTYTIPATGHTYAYIAYPPFPFSSGERKPTLLFLHGFPSTSYDWRYQLAYFLDRGYGVLIPDLLGYGGTSKPLDVNAYLGHSMSDSIISILDNEGLTGSNGKEVIGIAHDWGTYLLSQLIIYHDERLKKYVFFSVPHTMPGRKTDLVKYNKMTKEQVGYEAFGYQFFLSENERAGKVLGENWESLFNIIYPATPALWKIHMAPTGAMEAYLKSNTPSESAKYRASWVTEEDKVRHHEAFGDNYEACLNWYKRSTSSLGVDDEKELLNKGLIKRDGKIARETLMVAGLQDVVCSAERAREAMGRMVERGYCKVVDVDCGHWIMLEKSEETNRILEDFFENGVGGGPRSQL